MTSEQIEAFLHADENYVKFDLIPVADRLHPSNVLCGYLKLASMMKDPSSFEVAAEHDVVHMCNVNELREDITDDDLIYLHRCGIRYDSGLDCFSDFC